MASVIFGPSLSDERERKKSNCIMKAKELDRLFDKGEEITPYLDLTKARRPGHEQVRPRIIRAHFDGQQIRLDESCQLEPDTQLLVVVLPKHAPDNEHEDWLLLSRQALENAYGKDEPEYSLDAIKESNPEYERK